MTDKHILKFNSILLEVPLLLYKLSEEEMAMKLSPDKWSKKEILGHLIDSATNNHHRIIRAQYEQNPEILYDQNKWVSIGSYQQMDSKHIIEMWVIYNQHLLELIRQMPVDTITRTVKVNTTIMDLEHLITDYLEHMEHHLSQILGHK